MIHEGFTKEQFWIYLCWGFWKHKAYMGKGVEVSDLYKQRLD